ncbi:NAD(P)-binding protein [Stipitochalara longipes BDJ]|nr:NAD(P)-binding protein [Stipitochalara longipes BDJ]
MLDIFDLNGKTALITGGGKGIGQAMAIGLAEANCDIILILRDLNQTTTKDAIEKIGRKCHVYSSELGDKSSVQRIVSTVTEKHKIDILVNAAGIQRRCPAAEYPQETWDEVISVNLNSVFVLCRDMGNYWIKNKIKGVIINTASLATFQGGINMSAYAASKGAVGQLTKALSNEWLPYGIRVNAIAPGYIATDMNADTRTNSDTTYYDSITTRIPIGRWGDVKEFVGPAVFLASQASSYVSGEILLVDGGWMAR